MEFPYFNSETNQEFDCENEYYFKIKSFAAEHEYSFFNSEVIKFAISLKNEIIGDLKKDSSKSDKIKVEHIKWIEKYLDGVHDFMIQQKIKIPIIIKKQKSFVYTSNKNLIARPLGKRNILSRRKWIWIRDQYYKLKEKKVAYNPEEFAKLIRSQLFKEKPEFWDGNIYELETITDIIKRQKWGD